MSDKSEGLMCKVIPRLADRLSGPLGVSATRLQPCYTSYQLTLLPLTSTLIVSKGILSVELPVLV